MGLLENLNVAPPYPGWLTRPGLVFHTLFVSELIFAHYPLLTQMATMTTAVAAAAAAAAAASTAAAAAAAAASAAAVAADAALAAAIAAEPETPPAAPPAAPPVPQWVFCVPEDAEPETLVAAAAPSVTRLLRLTPDNVHDYIGCDIVFMTRGRYVMKRILDVTASGKTVTIDCPDLKNNIVLTRKVFVCM